MQELGLSEVDGFSERGCRIFGVPRPGMSLFLPVLENLEEHLS